mgnify:CR=1 FL=1
MERPFYARGMCHSCYHRRRRNAYPEREKARYQRRKEKRTAEREIVIKVNQKKWRDANKEKLKADKKVWYESLPWPQRNRLAGNGRGKTNVSAEFLQHLQESTPICSMPGCETVLDYERSAKQKPNQATLDKVIPSFGYAEGNVQIICRDCNSKKVHGTVSDWIRFLDYVIRHHPEALSVADVDRLSFLLPSLRIGNPI